MFSKLLGVSVQVMKVTTESHNTFIKPLAGVHRTIYYH